MVYLGDKKLSSNSTEAILQELKVNQGKKIEDYNKEFQEFIKSCVDTANSYRSQG
ncbi:hypothetical protein U8V72_25430 [Priestia filamentosa]|uniref:hypothetical protein n=1 Tax=Priestia filamentosa TaxID=1402861 RepID=UPI0039791329